MDFEEEEDFTNRHVFFRIDNLLEHFLLSWPRAFEGTRWQSGHNICYGINDIADEVRLEMKMIDEKIFRLYHQI